MNDTEKKLIAIRYTAGRTKRNNEHGFTGHTRRNLF
mgnify:CR=1 FL=1